MRSKFMMDTASPRRRKSGFGERGIFGLEAGIMILFVLGMMVVLGTIMTAAAKSTAGGLRIKELLLYTPRLKGGIADLARFGPDMLQGSELGGLEEGAGKLYSRLQAIAMGLMVGVFFFVGFCYMLEKYILPEGTTDRLIREAVLVVILLFIAPLLYNLLASGINSLNTYGILQAKDGNEAVEKAGRIVDRASDPSVTGNMVLDPLSKPISFTLFGGFTFVTIFSVGVLCFLRFFLTLAIAVLLPLVLVFRLYPPFAKFSSVLTDTIIGLVLSTILVVTVIALAQFLRLEGFTGWVFGLALLLMCSSLATILAPQIGGIISGAAHHISHSIGSMIGGVIAGAGTAGIAAGIAGVAGAARVGRAPGAIAKGMLSAGVGAAFGAPDFGKALMEGYRGSQKAVDEAMKKMDTALRGPGDVIQLQGVLDSVRPEEMLSPDRQEIQSLFVGGLGDPKVERGLKQLQMVVEGTIPEDQWARGIAKRGAWRVLGLDPSKMGTVINRLAENKEFSKEATTAGRAEVMRTLSPTAVKRLKSYSLPQDRVKLWDDIRKGYEKLQKNGFKLSKKPTVNERLAAAFIKTHLALGDWKYPPPKA
jgi:hypothetical protein